MAYAEYSLVCVGNCWLLLEKHLEQKLTILYGAFHYVGFIILCEYCWFCAVNGNIYSFQCLI